MQTRPIRSVLLTNVTVAASSVTPVLPEPRMSCVLGQAPSNGKKAHSSLAMRFSTPLPLGRWLLSAANWTAAGLTLKIGGDSLLHVYVTARRPMRFTVAGLRDERADTGPRSGAVILPLTLRAAGNPIPGGLFETGSGHGKSPSAAIRLKTRPRSRLFRHGPPARLIQRMVGRIGRQVLTEIIMRGGQVVIGKRRIHVMRAAW